LHKIVSLFTGAGGFDWGFHQAGGFKTVLANELLKEPASTCAANLNLAVVPVPAMPSSEDLEEGLLVRGDINNLSFSKLKDLKTNVLIGGPPCQDFTIARLPDERKGIETERGKLYLHFLRALEELKPTLFVFENVPGLLSSGNRNDIKIIRADLSKDYELIFDGVVNCVNLGLPQMRTRVIIIGVRKGNKRVKALTLKLNKTLSGRDKLFYKYPLTPLEVFEGKTLEFLQDQYTQIIDSYKNLTQSLSTEYQKEWIKKHWSTLTGKISEDYATINKIKDYNEAEFSGAMLQHEKLLKELGYFGYPVIYHDSQPLERKEVKDRLEHILPGANHLFVRDTEWKVKANASNIYRRTFPLSPAPTILAKGGGGTWGYHYLINRGKFSNKERARIQSFPDPEIFKFVGKDEQSIRCQLGEAVPPLLAKRIAQTLR
jgi:DNA (cytosine-5)-methyltransferase 1